MSKPKKETRIKRELDRLNKIYSPLPANELTLVSGLIQNAAFMKVTLDDLQTLINEAGCSEDYKNGKDQYGRKASGDVSAYNSMLKNYSAVIKQLDSKLPAQSSESKLEKLMRE